jgi:hypothetical protein
MNDWRQGSYINQMYKLKRKSFKLNLKVNILIYFNVLDHVDYLEMKHFLLEHSFKYRSYYVKKEQNKILIEIKLIKQGDYLKFYESDSDSDSDSEYSYTDDSGSNASDYSHSQGDSEDDVEFTQ